MLLSIAASCVPRRACSKSVNETSTEARLAPGRCTVEYKQLLMCTLNVQCCSAWPKPVSASKKAKFQNSQSSCSRIILVVKPIPQYEVLTLRAKEWVTEIFLQLSRNKLHINLFWYCFKRAPAGFSQAKLVLGLNLSKVFLSKTSNHIQFNHLT